MTDDDTSDFIAKTLEEDPDYEFSEVGALNRIARALERLPSYLPIEWGALPEGR